jgi:hypothetical protein
MPMAESLPPAPSPKARRDGCAATRPSGGPLRQAPAELSRTMARDAQADLGIFLSDRGSPNSLEIRDQPLGNAAQVAAPGDRSGR